MHFAEDFGAEVEGGSSEDTVGEVPSKPRVLTQKGVEVVGVVRM